MSTVFGATAAGCLLSLGLVCVTGATLHLHHAQAQAAADLSALSAAMVHTFGADATPCDLAHHIATAHAARLLDCHSDADATTVRVAVGVREAQATAGPLTPPRTPPAGAAPRAPRP